MKYTILSTGNFIAQNSSLWEILVLKQRPAKYKLNNAQKSFKRVHRHLISTHLWLYRWHWYATNLQVTTIYQYSESREYHNTIIGDEFYSSTGDNNTQQYYRCVVVLCISNTLCLVQLHSAIKFINVFMDTNHINTDLSCIWKVCTQMVLTFCCE